MTRKFLIAVAALIAALCVGCIEDGITTSPSCQPSFSVDTLNLGVVFTDQLTVTNRFTVYNNNTKGLNVSSIALSGDNAELFRLNVDGMVGRDFSDIEIRAKDSIFVFVEAKLPENGMDTPQKVCADLNFLVNGVQSKVVVAASGQDIYRIKGETLTRNTVFKAGKPYQITDSLVVDEGVTLTLEAGARLLFHDKARMIVKGRLLSKGTSEAPVLITGDRTGDVIPGVTFDLMSRQWDCIDFYETSYDNYMEFTEVSNTSYGVAVYGFGDDIERPKLKLVNCKLRNSGECVLLAFNASIEALGCEFAEAAYGLVYLVGGTHRFDHCTAANNYLFSAIENAAWIFVDPSKYEDFSYFAPTKALITNCITYGIGADVEPGDLAGTEIYFKRCLFKSAGTDDDNFINSLWETDPLFYTVRNEYVFDYRLKDDSPAISADDPSLTDHPLDVDFYGVRRNSDLGAYVYVPTAEN